MIELVSFLEDLIPVAEAREEVDKIEHKVIIPEARTIDILRKLRVTEWQTNIWMISYGEIATDYRIFVSEAFAKELAQLKSYALR